MLSYAAEGTLVHRLHNQGRLSLEDLERWGGDLLSAVSYLERASSAISSSWISRSRGHRLTSFMSAHGRT